MPMAELPIPNIQGIPLNTQSLTSSCEKYLRNNDRDFIEIALQIALVTLCAQILNNFQYDSDFHIINHINRFLF